MDFFDTFEVVILGLVSVIISIVFTFLFGVVIASYLNLSGVLWWIFQVLMFIFWMFICFIGINM